MQWQPQFEYLASLGEYQCLVYDNRGMGYSSEVPGRWTTSAMAADALQLLDHLAWKENVHIVGLSMGGMISQELALADTKRFSSITLLSTIAGGITSMLYFATIIPTGGVTLIQTFTSRDPKDQLIAGLKLLYPENCLREACIDPTTGKETQRFVLLRRALISRGKQTKKDGMPPLKLLSVIKQGFAVATHHVNETKLRALADHFGDAAIVVTGDEDILVHPENSRKLSGGLGCKLLVLPGSGHGANEQCLEEVNQAIRDVVALGEKLRMPTQSRL